jgi:hypothetical protein
MPLVPTTPTTETVYTPASKALNRFHLKRIVFNLVPGDHQAATAEITWVKGYNDNGTFIPTAEGMVELNGAQLIPIMGENVTAGISHYTDLRRTVWQLLQASGAAPAGTVT